MPQGENIRKLADKLGLEVYDVLGLPRPDPDLFAIEQVWDVLTPEIRRALRQEAESYVNSNEAKHRTPKRKRVNQS